MGNWWPQKAIVAMYRKYNEEIFFIDNEDESLSIKMTISFTYNTYICFQFNLSILSELWVLSAHIYVYVSNCKDAYYKTLGEF